MIGFFTVLPIASCAIPGLTMLISYLSAHHFKHLSARHHLLIINTIAESKPESIILSVGLCITVIVHLTLVYARYAQVLTFRHPPCPKANRISCVFGIWFVFGEGMIAVFPQSNKNIFCHYVAVSVYFSCVSIYLALQAYISITLSGYHRRWIGYIRCFFAMVTAGCPPVAVAGLVLPSMKVYQVSQIAEIVMLSTILTYIATFSIDFHFNSLYLIHSGLVRVQSLLKPSPCNKKSSNYTKSKSRTKCMSNKSSIVSKKSSYKDCKEFALDRFEVDAYSGFKTQHINQYMIGTEEHQCSTSYDAPSNTFRSQGSKSDNSLRNYKHYSSASENTGYVCGIV